MEFYAKEGLIVIRLNDSYQYDNYKYHKGQIISYEALCRLLEIYSEVDCTFCCISS